MTTMAPITEQEHYRIRDDSTAAQGGTPNWISSEDQATRTVIDADTNFRVRFTVANTGNASGSGDFSVYYKIGAGSYTKVGASAAVRSADASSSADGESLTSDLLTAGTGTRRNGQYDENNAASNTLLAGEYIELEYGLTIDSGSVSDADQIDLRVYVDDAALDTYDVTALIEVNVDSGVNVAATTDALVLTEQTADVNLDVSVAAGVDALTLTENAADVNLDVSVSAGVDALTLSTFGASVKADTSISAGVDTLTLTPLAATVTVGFGINAGVDALTLTANSASINAETNVLAGVDALTLTEFAATIKADISISAGLDALTLTANAATVNAETNVQASAAGLTLTEQAATVTITAVDQPVESGVTGGGGGPIIGPTRKGKKRRDVAQEERERREEIFARVRRLFDERENPREPEAQVVIQALPIPAEVVDALDDARRELEAFRREAAQAEFNRQIQRQLAEYEATVAEAERLMADEDDALAVLMMLAA